jgi:hypothetical protein
VWSASLLFFQLLLLSGHLYAHCLIRYLQPKQQMTVDCPLLLIGLFVTQWTGPFRTFFWYPVLVDYWLLPAVLAGLLIVERLRRGGRRAVWLPLLCLVSILAVTVRESGLLIPLAVTFGPMLALLSYPFLSNRISPCDPRLASGPWDSPPSPSPAD